MNGSNQGLKIHPDAIAYATSGMLDPTRKRILSYLQKAIKPVNQLRMMEDSLVIYRIVEHQNVESFILTLVTYLRVKLKNTSRVL